MDMQTMEKAKHLIQATRVMVLGVDCPEGPWCAPVYFVYLDGLFYFFSNDQSRHVMAAEDRSPVSATVFQDGDRMDAIFGLQMSGSVRIVSGLNEYLRVVRRYVAKFNFLKQIFGSRILDDRDFFLERFKSRLYGFQPDQVYLSDASRTTGKRTAFDLQALSNLGEGFA